jgi:two-component system, OmpR family, phosphate regulon sensor histidine kinase PhoR
MNTMMFRALVPYRLILLAALVILPAILVLAIFAAHGLIDAVPAIAGGSIALLAGYGAIRLHRADLRAVGSYVQALTEAEGAIRVPDDCPPEVRTVNAGVARLHRTWLRRRDQLAARLDANESILEALADPLVLIGADRRVIQANAAARGLFGDRMVERDLAVTLRNPHLLGAVDAVLGGASSKVVEFSLPVPVERVFQARVKPFQRREPDGEEEGVESTVILTLHDITTIKRSEQMRADFVANASHELRTPLSTLLGFIETLRGPARDDGEARERFLGIMHDQAGRMSRLVNDLLSLSRIELDEHTPPTGRVDLVGIAGNVIATLELKAATRRIRLRLDAPENVPPAVGDEDQIAQVLQNLIDNALKYTREQTEVTVTISPVEPGVPAGFQAAVVPLATGGRRGGRRVAVAVTDHGEGIPRPHLPRLTERFYRVDAARSRAMGGTGLGLAIVKHIVNRHRGRLTIESEVGKGSTFTVYLPIAADDACSDEENRRIGGSAA